MREVRVHRGGEGRLPREAAVPHAGGVAGRVLRLADAPAGAAYPSRRAVGPGGRGDPRRETAAVWESPDPRGTGRPWLPHEPQAGGAIDAGPRPGRPPPAPLPGDDAVPPPVSHCPQRLGTAIRPGPAGPG